MERQCYSFLAYPGVVRCCSVCIDCHTIGMFGLLCMHSQLYRVNPFKQTDESTGINSRSTLILAVFHAVL